MSVADILRQVTDTQVQAPPRREVNFAEARIFVAKASPDGTFEIHELEPNADLKPWAWCIMLGVKKSDHRDFQQHRCTVGTVLGDGRFVPSFTPRANLDELRLGSVSWDTTWDMVNALNAAAKAWADADQSWNIQRFVDRKGGSQSNQPEVHKTGKTERNRLRGKARPKKD